MRQILIAFGLAWVAAIVWAAYPFVYLTNGTILVTGGLIQFAAPAPPAGGNYALGSTGATTNRVTLDNESLYDFLTNSDFSVSCWFKTTDSQSLWLPIISKMSGAEWVPGWGLAYKPNENNFAVHIMGAANVLIRSGTTNIEDNTWHLLVGVKHGDGVMKTNSQVYCDTIELPYTAGNEPVAGDCNNAHAVSFFSDVGATRAIQGQIDEVVIWNKALSAAEIAQMYNATNRYCNTNSAPYNTGLISYWHLDENTGTATYGGNLGNANAYTGALVGVTWEAGIVEAP